MNALTTGQTAQPGAPASYRIVVIDSGEHSCLICPICGDEFKQDLCYWPHAQTEDEALLVCLDCSGLSNDLGAVGNLLGRLQDEVWTFNDSDGERIIGCAIPCPGGWVELQDGWATFVKEPAQ